MKNNTDGFSWKRGKEKSRKLKKSISCKTAFFLSFLFFYFIDGLKSQFIALSDHIQ